MNERFDNSAGCHYSPEYLCSLSDDELAEEINNLDFWDSDLNRELCWRADMLDEWDASGDESVIYAAGEKLGVEIK